MQPSNKLKQIFRTVSLWATVLVVLIHYRTAATLGTGFSGWGQELIVNGIARVAVPLFAFAAGFFYFLSATGTLANYLQKLRQRCRTLLIPYLLVALSGFTCWLAMRLLTANPTQLGWQQITSRIFLHPLAEQLWFLRDLFVLVILAPLIQWCVKRSSSVTLASLAILWTLELQPAPIIARWYVLNIETLLFFTLGCWCVTRMDPLERIIRASARTCILLTSAWVSLLAIRMTIDPGFNLWYAKDYTLVSLLLQKASITVGCFSVLCLAGRASASPSPRTIRVNALAPYTFFVYLVHEFPLRELLLRVSAKLFDPSLGFWIAAPAAIIISFASAALAARFMPRLAALLTGGRIQTRISPAPINRQTNNDAWNILPRKSDLHVETQFLPKLPAR